MFGDYQPKALGRLQPKSSRMSVTMLVMSACVFATTQGYDSALMSGLNIMPGYKSFLKLTTATQSLNVSSTFIGWGIASFTMGPVINRIGRKNGVAMSIVLKLTGVTLMTAAQNVGMFVSGRVMMGLGTGTSAMSASTWLAETLPPKHRGKGLSLTYTIFYVGALLAAGVTYGSARIGGSWCWRLPCLLQSIFSFACAYMLLLTPESPRWLIYQNRHDDALDVLAIVWADGDRQNPEVLLQHKEIIETLEWERNEGKTLTYSEVVRTPNARKRVMLAVSVAVLAMLSGNNIVSYYLGDMLTNAGITNKTTQLQINIVLSAWCLVCALTGTALMDKLGRKTLALVACGGMTVFLFLVGGLAKEFSTSDNSSAIYATVGMIFLFMGSYSVGITPITTLYPPEVLNYSIRGNGMAAWTLVVTLTGTFSTLVFPIALEAISWKLYMIVGSWDFLEFLFVLFLWVETKGLSLEEIDRLIDGKKHSNVPDLRTVEDATGTLERLDAKEGSSLEITDLGSEQLKKE